MIANNWMDPYSIIMGVRMMNVVTEALCVSGLVYAPFLVAIFVAVVEAMTQGADEGNAGELAVKFLRKKLLCIMPVFLMAFLPAISSPTHIAPTTPKICSDSGAPSPSNSTINMIGNFNGASAKVPMFWAAVHDFSSVATNTVISSTPCAEDMISVSYNVNAASFENPQTGLLADQWGKSCLAPAAGKVSQSTSFKEEWWIGHPDFQQEYKKEGSIIRVSQDVAHGQGLSGVEVGGQIQLGCQQVFDKLMQSSTDTLRKATGYDSMVKQLANKHNATQADIASRLAGEMIGNTSRGVGSRFMLPNGKPIDATENAINGEDSLFGEFYAATLSAMNSIVAAPDAVVYRQSIPLQMAMVQMVLLMVIPLLLVFSGFDIKNTLILAGLYFGIEFTAAIVSIASWMDNTIDIVTPTLSLVGVQARAAGLQLYTLLPMTWFVFLGFVGVKTIPGLDSHAGSFGGATGNIASAGSLLAGPAGKGAATAVGAIAAGTARS